MGGKAPLLITKLTAQAWEQTHSWEKPPWLIYLDRN